MPLPQPPEYADVFSIPPRPNVFALTFLKQFLEGEIVLLKSGESEGKKIPRSLECGVSCLLLLQAGIALAYFDHTVILKEARLIRRS